MVGLFLMNNKGLRVLEFLIDIELGHTIDYVVSSTDKGLVDDSYYQIKTTCEKNGIPFFDRKQDVSFKSSRFKLAIGWRWLIKDVEGLIVFHDSLLPKYRGFSPLVNSLINGEKQIGVTALHASEEYDSGAIIAQVKYPISYPIKIVDAIEVTAGGYCKLVEKILLLIMEGSQLPSIEQNPDEVSFSLWRDEDDYRIDWNQSSNQIKRFVDAVGFPYKGAKTVVDGETYRIDEVEVHEDLSIESRQAGKIIFFKDGFPVVVCGSGLIVLKKMRNEDNEAVRVKKFRTRFK